MASWMPLLSVNLLRKASTCEVFLGALLACGQGKDSCGPSALESGRSAGAARHVDGRALALRRNLTDSCQKAISRKRNGAGSSSKHY